jgi:signal transduction histidine kinase
MKALLVEDNPADERLIREIVKGSRGETFQFEHVTRLDSALERLRRESFAVVLLDLGLPDSQGIRTLELMQEGSGGVPIVVLTGLADERFALEAVRAGAQDYLVKGQFDRELLVRTVRYAVERRRAETSIQKERQRLHDVLETLPLMICLLAPDYRVVFANRTFRERFGEPRGRRCYEYRYGLSAPCEFCQSFGVLKTGQRHQWEATTSDGSVMEVHDSPFTDVDGSPLILQTNSDITERKRAEDEREQLRQAQADLARISRITTMGELTASLAHEIKQPIAAAITSANACARWLARNPPNLAEARADAARMVEVTTRASEIINRVRSLYKKEAPHRERVDINEVIRETLGLLRSDALRFGVTTSARLAADLPTVDGDRVQLQQVLLNLFLNGVEAMRETHGALTVESRCVPGEGVLITVADEGIGLPEGKADEIFEAFFTTKPEGTGMGLTISRSIVQAHGGRLWATPGEGRGACIHVALPAADSPPDP